MRNQDRILAEKFFKEMLLAAKTDEDKKLWASCLITLWFNRMFEGFASNIERYFEQVLNKAVER